MSPSHTEPGSPGTKTVPNRQSINPAGHSPSIAGAKASQNAQVDTKLLHPWSEDLPDHSLLGLTTIVSAIHTHTHTKSTQIIPWQGESSLLGTSLDAVAALSVSQSWQP